jgi:hypothetical protein
VEAILGRFLGAGFNPVALQAEAIAVVLNLVQPNRGSGTEVELVGGQNSNVLGIEVGT